MPTTLKDIFGGKSVSLIGAGVSNTPLAEKIAPLCSKLTIRDKKSEAELGESGAAFRKTGAELITGSGYLDGMNEDLILRSPGIRPDIPEFVRASASGSHITSEIELFLSLHPCRVFAITGSDGKTTTTTITSKLLKARGKVLLGGNIGSPLLYRLDSISRNDALAVELSSFQLMTMDAYFEAAAITNITPNHLNWHTGMDEYISAKRRILNHSRHSVLNYDNPETRKIAEELQSSGRPVILFSLSPIPDSALGGRDEKIWFDGESVRTLFRGEEEASTFQNALDEVMNSIERQLRKNKTKLGKRIREGVFPKEPPLTRTALISSPAGPVPTARAYITFRVSLPSSTCGSARPAATGISCGPSGCATC